MQLGKKRYVAMKFLHDNLTENISSKPNEGISSSNKFQ